MTISQAIAGLADGAIYRLSVDIGTYAAGDGASLRVSFGGETLGDIPNGALGWVTFTVDVLGGAGDGSDLLSISELGPAAAAGLGIDNVRLFALQADGDDTIDGDAGDDRMAAGRGNDTYYVDSAGDVVVEGAGEGTDSVLAQVTHHLGANVESLTLVGSLRISGFGNAEANTLTGNTAGNRLFGYDGDDSLDGGDGGDRLVGGGGADDIQGGNGNDTLLGGLGADSLVGGSGHDSLGGGADHDSLDGGIGNDVLDGGGGKDSLDGGSGNDTVQGGRGGDLIAGGTLDDVFRYLAPTEGHDTLTDFGLGDDRFEFSASGFGGGLVAGMDIAAAGRFVANATGKATIADGQFVLNLTTAELWFDANGTAIGGRTLIASLNTTSISAADFAIIA